VLSRHANQLLWIPVRGVILNEGASTAVITLKGETVVVSDESVLFPGEKPIAQPPELGTSFVRPQHLLGPGQKMLFAWGAGHLVEDWVAGYKDEDGHAICELVIEAEDISQARIVDEVRVQLAATLLFPTDDEDTWALTLKPRAHVALMVRPSPRRYINEST